jgi:heme-degrading monooxygenase HmoA
LVHVNYIDWHTHPFRAERWLEVWRPALDRALAFGATVCYLTRSIDDPLHFRQISIWESTEDFERYWASDEITALREAALNYFNKPLLPAWHTTVAVTGSEAEQAGEPAPAPART